MGKQPDIVVIARHGSRLDQADKNWHLTTPTPYDPPLTYGGWSQCQSLGARIGGILQAREEELRTKNVTVDASTNGHKPAHSQPRKRRRQRVMIHSSPFLRCIQTSVAISAGIGQFEKKTAEPSEEDVNQASGTTPGASTSSLKPTDHEWTVQPPHIEHGKEELHHSDHLPTTLRVDAFLGEWLSPDYFENITPPPGSALMVASAKAELLRPAEDIRGADLSGSTSNRRSSAFSWLGDEIGKHATHSIPNKSRAISFNNQRKLGSPFLNPGIIPEEGSAYNPPLPTYAISSSDKIPLGFFAHARDACVEVDYQWDSMREPTDWGNGGELGEEWSSMHRRFRTGFQRVLAYYENEPDSKEDEDEDVILILVTHGAGCNALIGAITSAPVLLDVGVASLTMAVRRDETEEAKLPQLQPTRTRRGSVDLGLSQQFNMKIIASTEHLRAATNPLGLNSPRLGRSPAFASRRMAGADSPEGFSLGDSLSWRPSSSSGIISRSASQRSAQMSTPAPSSTGLWSTASRLSRDDTADSSESDSFPNFDGTARKTSKSEFKEPPPLPPTLTKAEDVNKENVLKNAHLPVRTVSQLGLWGGGSVGTAGASIAGAPIARSSSPNKRRWTLVDKSP